MVGSMSGFRHVKRGLDRAQRYLVRHRRAGRARPDGLQAPAQAVPRLPGVMAGLIALPALLSTPRRPGPTLFVITFGVMCVLFALPVLAAVL